MQRKISILKEENKLSVVEQGKHENSKEDNSSMVKINNLLT